MRGTGGVLAAAALLFVGACGADKAKPTLTDIGAIARDADRAARVGSRVEIARAATQSVVGTHVFWAGDPPHDLPVLWTGGKVKRGDPIPGISGTLKLLSAAPAPLWEKVHPNMRLEMLESVVYIAADGVTTLP